MKYPTIEEIENADHKQICFWYKNLPSPGSNFSGEEFRKKMEEEIILLNRIIDKFTENGGMTSEILSRIGGDIN
jgi:hypothetical protein